MTSAHLPLIAEVPRPELHELNDVARLPDFTAAIRRQVNDARRVMTQADLAETVGMDKGQLSCVLNGKKHMPGEKWARFNAATGRATALQYVAMHSGFGLTPLDELRAENARLRARLEALGERL
jgi:hypothetical protein